MGFLSGIEHRPLGAGGHARVQHLGRPSSETRDQDPLELPWGIHTDEVIRIRISKLKMAIYCPELFGGIEFLWSEMPISG